MSTGMTPEMSDADKVFIVHVVRRGVPDTCTSVLRLLDCQECDILATTLYLLGRTPISDIATISYGAQYNAAVRRTVFDASHAAERFVQEYPKFYNANDHLDLRYWLPKFCAWKTSLDSLDSPAMAVVSAPAMTLTPVALSNVVATSEKVVPQPVPDAKITKLRAKLAEYFHDCAKHSELSKKYEGIAKEVKKQRELLDSLVETLDTLEKALDQCKCSTTNIFELVETDEWSLVAGMFE